MMRSALNHAVMLGAASAAAGLTVFAGGFALYALVEPRLGPAGAAAIVALAAALIVALVAIVMLLRIRTDERRAAEERARQASEPASGFGGFTRDHPLLTLGATALAGVLSARYPNLAQQLMSLFNPPRRPE
jgi:formate hydrogenlyase subunit 3/multisubunit Na+/H+ antiporter MnhD subunit